MVDLRFDICGRYRLDVERDEGGWRVMRVLDDLFHEEAFPGATIRRFED